MHPPTQHCTTPPCILPLPAHVVAQLKSSATIVSLPGVVLELLKNSLDARATKIDATVDFARGGCVVEDDGLGISPLEFSEDGGLAKLYCTSKYHSSETLLGRNGTFLASLAAMSLLTLASRHHQHRSQNMMAIHHAKVIERQLPASSSHHIHGKQGTRVTVRNLFGNMPVRVKQRSMALGQKAESDRLWNSLKRDVTCLLLSWQGPVSLRIRDGNNQLLLTLNTSTSTEASKSLDMDMVKSRPAHLSSLLNVLTQAGYLSINDWAMWVPVSASTATISIKGAISIDPAPTKHLQFISLGIRPVSADVGHNELYDEVNRLFALSSFGTIDDDADVDELEKIRRRSDKRFKTEGYTNRQLKARKGVDKHPMFHLRISLKGAQQLSFSDERLIGNNINLQAVVGILDAMITQWLSVHHFRPRKLQKKQSQFDSTISAANMSNEDSNVLTPRPMKTEIPKPSTARPSSTATGSRKRKRSALETVVNPSGKMQSGAFAEWSRIKSGKAGFFSNLPRAVPMVLLNETSKKLADASKPACPSKHVRDSAKFDLEPLPLGAFSNQTALRPSLGTEDEHHVVSNQLDDTMLWVDPSTEKTYTLNARTGCVVPPTHSRPHTDLGASAFTSAQPEPRQSLRLAPKSATLEAKKTPWLDGILQSWDNPVFNSSERCIQQICVQEQEQGHHQQSRHSHCPRINVDKAFGEASTAGSSKLSKEGLRGAEVLAQLDKKFILIKMQNITDSIVTKEGPTEVLVLIDQHAADERIRVESLLRDLCTPPIESASQAGYQSKLGHKSQIIFSTLEKPIQFTMSAQERTHFITHAARFAAWGILFDILEMKSLMGKDETMAKRQHLLSVTTLPPVITERCRTDAQLLISFLRLTVWAYAQVPHLPPLLPFSSDDDPSAWVRRLATCPQGLLDLINSRACRSAIMFNDELSLGQCKVLVQKLAGCVFPFMCAHGRPSMVPLVDLGRVGHVGNIGHLAEGSEFGANSEQSKLGFVQAWKSWKGRRVFS